MSVNTPDRSVAAAEPWRGCDRPRSGRKADARAGQLYRVARFTGLRPDRSLRQRLQSSARPAGRARLWLL